MLEGIECEARIAVVGTDPPVAVMSEATTSAPANVLAGQLRLLVFLDTKANRLRAFDRNAKDDLFLTFQAKRDRQRPQAVLADVDTSSSWTIDGRAIDGPLKDVQLKEYAVEPDLYWGVMKRWYPQLQLAR
jgi:hypothetical protein